MRNTARATLLITAVAATFSIGLLACSNDTHTPADSEQSLDKFTLMLNWSPNAHHVGIYLAEANGWYRDAGLDLEIIEPATIGVEAAVDQGHADIGVSHAEYLLPARQQGAQTVAVAALLPKNDSVFMSLEHQDINSASDFEGLTYAGYGGALETSIMSELMKCEGADPTKVNVVEVGDVDYLALLESNRADFVWVFEGWDVQRVTAVEGIGTSVVPFDSECIPNWYTPILIANESNLDSKILRTFMEITARGYTEAAKDPVAAAKALSKLAPEVDERWAIESARYYSTRWNAENWGLMEAETWVEFTEFLVETGLLEAPKNDLAYETAKAWTNQLVE